LRKRARRTKIGRGEEAEMHIDEIMMNVRKELMREMDKYEHFVDCEHGGTIIAEVADDLAFDIEHGVDGDALRRDVTRLAALAIRFLHDLC
jgi:hypothetical protein